MRSFLFLAIAAALAGCADSGPDSCLPECGGTRGYDARAYHLRGRYDWSGGRLVASEDITVALHSAADAVVVLDAEVAVSGVRSSGGRLAYRVDEEAHTLTVDLTPLAESAAEVVFTVDYEAVPSDALIAALPAEEDPVKSRVVFSDSEPDRGRRWLVANHDPADRALWSVELTVAPDEDVIANGERLSDAARNGSRVVGYGLDAPIPTYLMAFAAGQLEHTERAGGRVPLGLWYRRGLVLDPDDNLDAIADAMASFDKLLGPYPWDRYSVVLVPQLGGGMENATITFNNEVTGQGIVGFSLNAHELGHHWFGDWVTMRGYDDVWIKEGMATLLQSEATRARRDREGRGRLFGSDFNFDRGDAIVNPTLQGFDKYTSGPYERAAWTISQIRARVGEEAFWAGLRKVLAEHALDSVDGESFVRSFAPALDEAAIQQVLASLEVVDVPAFDVVTAANPVNPDDTDVTITMSDPAHLLLAPIEVTVVDAAGQATVSPLPDGVPVTLTVPLGGYLAPDEKDLHPYWTSSFEDLNQSYSALTPYLTPTAPEALVAFETRSPSHQERALAFYGTTVAVPEQLGGFHDALDSEVAQRLATTDACATLRDLPPGPDADAWQAALTPLVLMPAQLGFSSRFAVCGVALPVAVLGDELDELAAHPAVGVLARLEYLLSFDYGPARSLAVFSELARGAPSLRLRNRAFDRLGRQAQGQYSEVPAGEVPAWTGFFRAELIAATSVNRLFATWFPLASLDDLGALPLLAAALRRIPMEAELQAGFACEAYDRSQEAMQPAAWEAFKAAAEPRSTLAPGTQRVLDDPQATCHPGEKPAQRVARSTRYRKDR